MAKRKQIAVVDFDEAEYIGSEEDGVYIQVAKARNGWYVSGVVDCNSAHFTDVLFTDDGPYKTETEAQQAGRNGAHDWCSENQVATED